MPCGDPDGTDPMTLYGVLADTGAPPCEAIRQMAECFISEYARLGFDRARILRMFTTKGYAGPHMAYKLLGEAEVCELIDDVLAPWGPVKESEPLFRRTAQGELRLSVLP